jgi:hypothetical protein
MAKQSLMDRLKAKREQISKNGGDYDTYIVPKDSTLRVRVLPFDQEEGDFSIEATTFYLGGDMGTVISPVTFGEDCPIYDMYKKLKDSKDSEDKALADKLKPKKKYYAPIVKYKDLKDPAAGVDDKGVKLLMMPQTVCQQMLDYFLEPEQGDFTEPLTGYDLKIKRTGSGQMDTEYTVVPCKPTKLPKEFRKQYSAEAMLKEITKPYEELEGILAKFLKLKVDDEDAPKKDKSSVKKKIKKTKGDM